MSAPWYRDGLRFECIGCGACCTGEPGYVWVARTEIARLARRLGLEPERFARRYLRRVGRRFSLLEKPSGECVFWQGRCSVYEDRPLQCRTFPFWPENLSSRGEWSQVAESCEGIGRGRLYPQVEVRAIAAGGEQTALGPPERASDRAPSGRRRRAGGGR